MVAFASPDQIASSKRRCDLPAKEFPVKKARTSGQTIDDWIDSVQQECFHPEALSAVTKTSSASPTTSTIINGNKAPHIPLFADAIEVLNGQPTVTSISADGKSTTPSKSDGTATSKDKGINAYHKAFLSALMTRSIEPPWPTDKREPSNLNAFMRAIRQDRASPEPSEEQKRNVQSIMSKSYNELTGLVNVIGKIVQYDTLIKDDRYAFGWNLAWDKAACLPRPKPIDQMIACPQPDIVLGWTARAIPHSRAVPALQPYCAPLAGVADIMFPCVAVEGKGEKGSLKVAQLQNLHNGATMLWNLFQVRKLAGEEDEFLDKIQVISLSVTLHILELSYHWLSKDDEGYFVYLSKPYDSWAMTTQSMEPYVQGRKCVQNAIDWILAENIGWITTDLKLIVKTSLLLLHKLHNKRRRQHRRSYNRANGNSRS